jgi:hypothetical protein
VGTPLADGAHMAAETCQLSGFRAGHNLAVRIVGLDHVQLAAPAGCELLSAGA